MMKLITTVNRLEEIAPYLQAGADEVVVAVKDHSFTALNGFTLEQVKGYQNISLMMNRLYHEHDLEDLKAALATIRDMEVLHIYVADPAMLYYGEQYGLLDKMIYRPETLMTNSNDAKWWLDRGIYGVSISPLLTKSEVLQMLHNVEHCEVSIHGHLLMSVSRRHLLHAYETVQNKELNLVHNQNLTLVEMKRDGHMPVFENEYGTMIYTDFVQTSFESLQDFIDAGVDRCVINSVFMKEEEVIKAIRYYKDIMNGTDGSVCLKAYQLDFPNMEMSSGYYGQKTIL